MSVHSWRGGGASVSHVTRPDSYLQTQRHEHEHSTPGGAGDLQSFPSLCLALTMAKGRPVTASTGSAGQNMLPQSKRRLPGGGGGL